MPHQLLPSMTDKKPWRCGVMGTLWGAVFIAAWAGTSIESGVRAHGGLERWQSYGSVTYHLKWGRISQPGQENQQTIDLKNRRALVEGKSYTVGFDGHNAWVTPSTGVLGMPPQFYALTAFYYFAMPFVFEDQGVKQENLGTETVGGKSYDAVKITFSPGHEGLPEDTYVADFNPHNHRLEIVHYLATHPLFRQDGGGNGPEKHAAVFSRWQVVQGLRIPEKVELDSWTGSALGPRLGTVEFEEVIFKKEEPLPEIFKRPEGAEVNDSKTIPTSQPSPS